LAGWKQWLSGEVVEHTEFQSYLQDQVVQVYAGTAARGSVLGTAVSEGMVAYLEDTNVFQVYNGSTWQTLPTSSGTVAFATNAGTAVYSTTSGTAAYATNAGTAVYATNAGTAVGLSGTITASQVSGTAVTRADTATVTNTMLANSSITLNGTAVALGGSATISGGGGGSTSPNYIINGGMDIWQRGTSFSNFGFFQLYTTDQWNFNSTNSGRTISRQPTSDTTNLPDIQFCARLQRDSGNTDTSISGLSQSLETVNSIPLAGKTVTFSFYARAGSNYSATSNALVAQVLSGTGTDQKATAGFTGQVTFINSSATLTTTWQRFTYSATVPVNSRQLAIYFKGTPTGTAGANDYYEVTGVQLEAGSTATPFRRNANSIQGELAACQRYYYRATADGSNSRFGVGHNTTTTVANILTTFPVTMRTSPTALEQTGTAADYSIAHANTTSNLSSVPTFNVANTSSALTTLTVASGLTAGQGSGGRFTSTSAYLGWSAEI
jgi:hypothetical protein